MIDTCGLAINNDICSATPYSTPGRDSVTSPAAIVIHQLDMPMDEYYSHLMGALPANYPTSYPKSVHYVVADNGSIIGVVPPQDTAFGIDEYHNPTWPMVGSLPVTANVNNPYIHVAMEYAPNSNSLTSLVQLVCCLAGMYNLAVSDMTIIVARDLDDRRDELMSVPTNVVAMATTCQQMGGTGGGGLPNIVECCNQVSSLTAAVQALQATVSDLQLLAASSTGAITLQATQLAALIAWQSSVTSQLATLTTTVGGFAGQLLSLHQVIGQLQRCADRMCPPDTCYAEIMYSLGAGQEQQFIPNAYMTINFPTYVTDTRPPSVLPGPLWSANLDDPCMYRVTATVHLASSLWCPNRTIGLYLVACGQRYPLQEIATGAGVSDVLLTGTYILTVPPACNDVHVEVWTDDISEPARVADYGTIRIEPLC